MNDVSEPVPPSATAPMLVEESWEHFASAGLFWWVNRSLHLFGWALVREMMDGKIVRVYPARCRFRGFDEATESDGFVRLTAHLRDNADELVTHTKE